MRLEGTQTDRGAPTRQLPISNASGVPCDVVGSGSPLVLIHGTAGSRKRWSAWPHALASDYTLVLPDLPGAGHAANPDGALELLDVAEDTAGRAAAAVDGPYHLVGYSLGAEVAVTWAAQRPHEVSSLLLLGGWLRTDAKMRAVFRLWMYLIDNHGPEAFLRYAIVHGHGPDVLARLGDAGVEQEVRDAVGDVHVDAALRHCDLDLRVDVSDLAASVSCPAVVVGGTHDQFVSPASARGLADALPRGRYVELDCGHGDLPDDPRVYDVMRDLHAQA